MHKSRQLLWYTLGFLAVSAIAFWPLIACGKGFINGVDGLTQQYGTFVDVGKTIRSIVRDLLAGKGLLIPAYDLSMGYGSPRIWPFDPFMYLSALCPTAVSETLFNVLVFVKLWLCGIAVLPLTRELGVTEEWGIAAALTYAFSGEGLNCMLQMQYLNTMILFPLMVFGAVRIVRGGDIRVFALASGALGLVIGWYGLYAADLQVAIVVAVVLFVKRSRVREWVRMLARFVGAIAISFAISAARIPSVLKIASLDRIGVQYSNPTLYSGQYYQRLLSGFTGVMFGERDWFFGFGAIGLLCAILLWVSLKREQIVYVLRVLFCLATLFVCVPFFGSLFNGTSYVANRWVYGYSLLIACIVGTVGTRRQNLTTRRMLATASILFVYCAAVIILPDAVGIESRWQMLVAWGMLAVMAAREHVAPTRQQLLSGGFAALMTVGLGINYAMFISPYGSNWQERLVPLGTAYDCLAGKTPASLASEVVGERLVRTDRSISLYNNVATPGLLAHRVLDTYGVDFYASQYNNSVDRFHRDLALAESDLPNVYTSLDQRYALQRLMGVETYVAREDDGMARPYGFARTASASLVGVDGMTYDVYMAHNVTQIAHIVNGQMNETTYRALAPLERQETLLRAVVLPDEEAKAPGQFKPSSIEVPFTAETVDESAVLGEGYVDIKEPGSSIELRPKSLPAASELYLAVDKLTLKSVDEPWSFDIGISSDYSQGTVTIFTSYFHLYGGKDSWLWNVGYHEEGTSVITLTFWTPGRYSFASFKMLAQPMGPLERASDAWGTVEDLCWDRNACTLSCDADGDKGEFLFFAIPYDGNWHAFIDGGEVEVLVADTAFMALRLPAGRHRVTLSYESTSWVLLAIGLVATTLCVAVKPKRKASAER